METMESENVPQTGSLLSAREYLTAILQEYQTLRDEIKLRTQMRNGILIAFGTAVAVGIGKILLIKEPLEPTLFSFIILLGVLPLFWFLLLTFQVVLMAQVDRVGRALSIIERKVQLLFTSAGEQSLKTTIEEVEAKLHLDLTKAGAPNIRGLGNAMVWERLLRIGAAKGAGLRFHWWDSAWCRNTPCFLTAAVLSSVGPAILATNECLEWLWAIIWMLVYFIIATILIVFFTRFISRGVDWDSLMFSLDVPVANQPHVKQDSRAEQ